MYLLLNSKLTARWCPSWVRNCKHLEMGDAVLRANEYLEEGWYAFKLHKLDVNKQDSLMFKTDIKLTASAKEVLKNVPTNLHQGLKDSWVMILKKTVEEIQDKIPLGYKLEFLLPWIPGIWRHLMLTLMQLLKSCTAGNEFQANKVIVLKSNLNNFCRIMVVNKNEFLDFNVIVTRLDDFLACYVFSSSLYKDFWYVCNFILSLCHGQSSVEHRFNVNQQTMMKNLEELGLTSLKNCLWWSHISWWRDQGLSNS